MQEKYKTLLENFVQMSLQFPSNGDETRCREFATGLVKWTIMQDTIRYLAAKELSNDAFALDLNPHLTVNYCIEQVQKAVETEGLPCEKYDVALLWLTKELVDKVNT